MNTRYNVGDIILERRKITKITISEGGVQYFTASPTGHDVIPITRETKGIDIVDSTESDSVPAEVYEEEVNKLKDEINRLRMIIANAP